MRGKLHDALIWLSTADRDVLAKCPEGEETRFIASGGAVLSTTGMALLSGTFAFHLMLHVPLVPAILLGLAFALLIMNLERYVQASIKRQGTTFFTLLSAVPRLVLAFLMGLVLAIPLLLLVFGSEVNLQARADRNAELFAARQAINRQFPQIESLQRRADTLEGQIHAIKTGTALKTSPAYVALGRRLNRLQALRRTTKDPKLARSYARQANGTLAKIRPLREKLLEAERVQTQQAQTAQRRELTTVRDELAPMTAERDRKLAEVGPQYHGDPGLADRIKALDELTHHNSAVGDLKNLLWIFILAIDSMPAVLKTLLSVGRPSVYEDVLDAHELGTTQTTVRTERLRTETTIKDATAYYAAQSDIAASRLARHVDLQKEMDEIFMDAVRDALRPRAEAVAERAAARYADQMEDFLDGGSGPTAEPETEGRRRERAARPGASSGILERIREWFGFGQQGRRRAA
ncbi:MAG TPA: DUF4407 domain-containing protein [Baekduia sp.]|nr:DUF4407 domain-containing protein [Baekduia sp.]